MAVVTDLEYHLDGYLVNKLDIMIKLCTNPRTRKDAVLICEGSEGEGKTNSSEAMAYYVKHKTGRDIHMFFRLKSLIEFAQNTESKIIIWDEPALDSLSTDWWKEANKDLIRLLMTCRKKRHFFIFNFVKFYKFSEYVVVDRAVGMVHMFTRMKDQKSGRFVYIKKNQLQNLWITYKQKKIRGYHKFKAFGGGFPIVENMLDKMGINIEGQPNCSLDDYEKLKDKAIESIGKLSKKENPDTKKYNELRKKIGDLNLPIRTQEDLAKKLGVSRPTLWNWSNIKDKNIQKTPPCRC